MWYDNKQLIELKGVGCGMPALSPQDEKAYSKQVVNNGRVQLRVVFAVLIVLYGGFGYLDLLLIEDHLRDFLLIRFAIVVPLFAFTLLLTFYPIFERIGQYLLTGILGITRDITDRKKAEESLRLQVNERAAVDAFTNSVSHDLQAPLRRIEGFSEALLEECSDQVNDQARDYLERINRQVDSMKVRTNALLKLSRVVSCKIAIEEVDLSALARSHLDRLHISEPDRRVERVVAPDMSAKGDLVLLNIVMENLTENAWKFTSGVENGRIECGSFEQDGKTVYFIKDNGVGFDQQRAGKLFVPFQKLHSGENYPGIGIGLNIVYRIISRLGGEIWAEGEPGKGACICFTLP